MANPIVYDTSRCAIAPGCAPRPFWATQPDACGTDADACDAPCGMIGLRLIATDAGTTIDTNGQVRSLIINTLLTQGRGEDRPCGYLPGRRGGHWTEAFMGAGTRVGARFNDVPMTGSIVEAVRFVQRIAQASLAWLVTAKIVSAIDVTATYAGRGLVDLTITATIAATGSVERVGLSGARGKSAWTWSF